MKRASLTCEIAAFAILLNASIVNAQDFVELTLDKVPDESVLKGLTAALYVSSERIKSDLEEYGISTRVVAVRPGADLSSFGEIIELPLVVANSASSVSIPGETFPDLGDRDTLPLGMNPLPPSPSDAFNLPVPGGSGGSFLDNYAGWRAPSFCIGVICGAEMAGSSMLGGKNNVITKPLLPTANNTSLSFGVNGANFQIRDGSGEIKTSNNSLQVMVDGFPPEVIQASDGRCGTTAENWPFQADRVSKIVRFGDDVLEKAGVGGPERARILIVDSGIPETLLRNEQVRRVLDVQRIRVLTAGHYAENLSDADNLHGCELHDDQIYATVYGLSPPSDHRHENRGYCAGSDVFGALSPPVPDPPVDGYEPAHGAFVASLAAGGPLLLNTLGPQLESHLAIAMARIADASGQVLTQNLLDVVNAVRYADLMKFDVLNLSFSIFRSSVNREILLGALKTYSQNDGLIIVAAGNHSARLLDGQSFGDFVPVPVGIGVLTNALVVGGVQMSDNSGIVLWSKSNHSNTLVEIGAPATGVMSFDLNGNHVCTSGTSISTPQVSFVAAMLRSFGLWSANEVKWRILSTADVVPALESHIKEGRVLNVANSLDVFSDLIWTRDTSDPSAPKKEPDRVLILDEGGNPGRRMIKLCDSGTPNDSATFLDTRKLLMWERTSAGTARVWKEESGSRSVSECAPESDIIPVLYLSDGRTSNLNMTDIIRIVPSRFRVEDAVREVAAQEWP